MSLAHEALTLGFFYAKHTDDLRNQFISFLPDALQKKIVQAKNISYVNKTLDLQTLFTYIHPSHVTDYLSTLEPIEAKTFLSCLKNPNERQYIQSLNFEPFTPFSLNQGYKTFLLSFLFNKSLGSKNFTAQEFLRNEAFIQLLYLDFSTFNRLLEVLAMYDIHFELHTIISKEQIKKLTSALNESQCEFLTSLKGQNKTNDFYPMGLSSFDGNKTRLNLILRQRALNRLAKALNTCSTAFINQLYLRLSSVEKTLFSKLLHAYQGRDFNQEKEHLLHVVSFVKG